MKSQTRVLSALWFLLLVNYLDRVAISFAGPSIMKSLAMTPTAFGIVLSSFGLGYLLGQLPGGLLADKLGGKLFLVVGPLLWALFTGLTGLVSVVIAFAIVRACFGFSEGLSNASIYKTVGENFGPRERARALAICSSALPIAPAFAGPLVGKLIGAYGWQVTFYLMTIPAIFAAIFSFILIPAKQSSWPARIEHRNYTGGSLSNIFVRPSFWLLSSAAFAWNIAYWGYLGWMPSYLALARHINLKSMGIIAGIPYLLALVGMVIGGWLGSGRLHRRCPQIVTFCFLGTGLFLFIAYTAETLPSTVAGLSGAAFLLFATHGPIGKIVLDLAPEQSRASYVGLYNTAGQLGGTIAPAIIGSLVSLTGTFAAGFGFMVIALVVAAACMLALVKFLPFRPVPPVPLPELARPG